MAKELAGLPSTAVWLETIAVLLLVSHDKSYHQAMGLAHHRQPQPHRPAPPPIHPRPLTNIRPHHARLVRIQPGRGRLLRRTRQRIPQNPRRRLGRPPQLLRWQVHHLQLLRHHMVPVRPILATSSQNVPHRTFHRETPRILRIHQKRRAKAILKGLSDSSNKTIVLKDHLTNLSFNVISRMALGKKYSEKTQNAIVSPEELQRMLDELFLLNGVLNIGDFIPWIHFLDLQGYVKKFLGKNLP